MTSESVLVDDPGPTGVHRPGSRARGHVRTRLTFGRTVSRTLEHLRGFPPCSWLHGSLQRRIEFTSTEVELPRGASELDGLTVAFLSDAHAGFYMTEQDLAQIGRRLAALAPDLVCLGGDMLATRLREVEMIGSLVRALDPPLGTFAILGNHECFYLRGNLRGWFSSLRELGIRPLINEGVRIERGGASLWLGGVDDYSEGTPDVTAALRGRGAAEPTVLLSHHPDYFLKVPPSEVDLVIAGHTHGGQITFGSWAPITHSGHGYVSGLYEREGTQMFVGRGLGVSALPIRIGAKAEAAILRLRRRATSAGR